MSGSVLGSNGSTGKWLKLRKRILERDGYRCRYCRGPATSVDHIIPRKLWPEGQPGVDDPSNLVAACKSCNSRKGARIMPADVRPPTKTRRQW